VLEDCRLRYEHRRRFSSPSQKRAVERDNLLSGPGIFYVRSQCLIIKQIFGHWVVFSRYEFWKGCKPFSSNWAVRKYIMNKTFTHPRPTVPAQPSGVLSDCLSAVRIISEHINDTLSLESGTRPKAKDPLSSWLSILEQMDRHRQQLKSRIQVAPAVPRGLLYHSAPTESRIRDLPNIHRAYQSSPTNPQHRIGQYEFYRSGQIAGETAVIDVDSRSTTPTTDRTYLAELTLNNRECNSHTTVSFFRQPKTLCSLWLQQTKGTYYGDSLLHNSEPSFNSRP
jgi:hypothetical protein